MSVWVSSMAIGVWKHFCKNLRVLVILCTLHILVFTLDGKPVIFAWVRALQGKAAAQGISFSVFIFFPSLSLLYHFDVCLQTLAVRPSPPLGQETSGRALSE